MCGDCFLHGYPGFDTELTFADFYAQLLKKLAVRALRALPKRADAYLPPKAEGLYYCQNCGEVWALSTPDNAWRGYFLPGAQAASYFEKEKRKTRITRAGCLILLLVALAIFLWNNFH